MAKNDRKLLEALTDRGASLDCSYTRNVDVSFG